MSISSDILGTLAGLGLPQQIIDSPDTIFVGDFVFGETVAAGPMTLQAGVTAYDLTQGGTVQNAAALDRFPDLANANPKVGGFVVGCELIAIRDTVETAATELSTLDNLIREVFGLGFQIKPNGGKIRYTWDLFDFLSIGTETVAAGIATTVAAVTPEIFAHRTPNRGPGIFRIPNAAVFDLGTDAVQLISPNALGDVVGWRFWLKMRGVFFPSQNVDMTALRVRIADPLSDTAIAALYQTLQASTTRYALSAGQSPMVSA